MSTSTYTYSNTMTNFLTETNSLGVVTGMPNLSNGYAPVAETAQPAVATIPAGLASGSVYTLAYGNASSFTVSIGSSTTYVLGAAATGISVTEGSATTGTAGASGTHSGTHTGTATSNTASGTGSQASATSSGAASANMKAASGAVLGLGALMAFAL